MIHGSGVEGFGYRAEGGERKDPHGPSGNSEQPLKQDAHSIQEERKTADGGNFAPSYIALNYG